MLVLTFCSPFKAKLIILDSKDESEHDYKNMVSRDERRFKRADKDTDGKLNKDEFASFLHPENDDSMKDIVVEETMEDIDKNKDGFVSLEEYIGMCLLFSHL